VPVPADLHDNLRGATKGAGRIVGLDVLRFTNESTGATIAYGSEGSVNTEKNVPAMAIFSVFPS